MNKYLLAKKLLRYERPLLIFIIIIIIYCICDTAGVLIIPKLKVSDFFLNLKYKFSPRPKYLDDIVIIGIDDSTYYRYGKKWPWERNIFANLVYKLTRYNPAVIGFGLAFIGKSPLSSESDSLLAEAFRDSGNIILASYFDKEGNLILPFQVLRESALGYGFTNKPEDADNVMREIKLFEYYPLIKEIAHYSFDLKVVLTFLGRRFEDIKFIEHTIPLNYSAKMSDFTVIPFEDVITEKTSLDFIQDKIVLIGTIGEIFHDASLTPFGRMPGIGVIANSILMLLNESFIYKAPPLLNIMLLIILGLFVSISTFRVRIHYGSLLVFATLGGFIVISLILVINNVSWDFFSLPVVVLAIYLTGSLTNYANLLVQSLRIKRVVISDILTGLPTRRYFLFKLENTIKGIKREEELSLVLFSIDNFRLIVSRIEPDRANQLIKEVGNLIARYSRKTRGVDFISRYGEIEFCSILSRTPESGAVSYANRIRKLINARITMVSPLTLSAGIACIRDLRKKSAKLFVKCAETALNRGRKDGPDKLCIYSPDLDKVPITEYEEEKEISEADLSYVAEELKEKYNELVILVNKLRTAQEDVIKSERLSEVGKVVATIHHDLSKPIVNMRNILEIIKEDLEKVSLPELSTAKKLIASALGESKRLTELGESLKSLYRPIPLEKELLPIQINQIIEEMLNLSRGQMIKNNITLHKNLDPALPIVLASSGELKQVFLNLIYNAIESMPGGGELKIISSVAMDREGMVEIKITDTGCGIPLENLDKIFHAFFTTKKEEGAGLGLYASSEIVKKYGGTLKAESVLNKGSTFTVYLPFKPTR